MHTPNNLILFRGQMTISVLIITFSITLILVAYKIYCRPKLNLPPGPKPWPIIGNLRDLKPIRHRCFTEWSRVYGPILSVWYGSSLDVVVSNSQLAKQVLKENDQHFLDRYKTKSSDNHAGLMWVDYGPTYVTLRKVCTLNLFSPKSLETLRPIRENELSEMVKYIYSACTGRLEGRESLMLRKYLQAMGFNTVTRLVLGKRFVAGDGLMDAQGKEILSIFRENLEIDTSFSLVERVPWLRWMLRSKKAGRGKLEKRRDQLILAAVEESRIARMRSGETTQCFADMLFSLAGDKYEISERDKIGLLWDLIIAGMDTTAVTVEWAMTQLIKSKRVQRKAQEELDRVIGTNKMLSEADFPKLTYLRCLAKEALRLHPPTPLMLPHTACVSTEIGGYDIPKGANVNINVWNIARDPSIWSNPLEFRPERFMEEDVDVKGTDFRLLPFGAGRRVCPAAHLGLSMVMSTLGNLLHSFNWNAAKGVIADEIDMSESPGLVNFMASPLRVAPTPRLPVKLYQRL